MPFSIVKSLERINCLTLRRHIQQQSREGGGGFVVNTNEAVVMSGSDVEHIAGLTVQKHAVRCHHGARRVAVQEHHVLRVAHQERTLVVLPLAHDVNHEQVGSRQRHRERRVGAVVVTTAIVVNLRELDSLVGRVDMIFCSVGSETGPIYH